MRTLIAASLVASLFTVLAVPSAGASPTQVNVRIEGRSETLFEGPILTEPHRVKAFSDAQWRLCNGINVNDPLNVEPAPVPTSASSDAMRIIGETFNGQWYNQYDDYFITRWGPETQDPGNGAYWGIVVNNVFTNVGGCQYQLDGGDEVLWVYDAFDNRPRLSLYPAGYSAGAVPLTATATLNQPFEIEADGRDGYNEGLPPASPQRSGESPFEGAEVGPVQESAKGFEEVETDSPATVTTGPNGRATIIFTKSGWHRIKATVVGAGGAESVVRSNRLDVCVPEPPASGCGSLPDDDQARMPPPPVAGEAEPAIEEPQPKDPSSPVGGQPSAAAPNTGAGAQSSAIAGQVRLQLPPLDRSRIGQGLVKVSWRVLDAGVGVRGWTIASKALGRRGARYVTRASGTDATSALLHLQPGVSYLLRLTVTDALGRSSATSLGKVRVPDSDAARARRGD